jgi:hypothetical protein
MRTAALLALVVATLACGSEPAAPADAGSDAADPCAGVSCLPGSVCSRGACVLAPSDAGPLDVVAEVGAEVGAEAAVDAPGEVGSDADPGCPASAPASCVSPGFGPGCWNLATSNGMVPARHCGACNRECPATAPECVGGRCTEATGDAGRD